MKKGEDEPFSDIRPIRTKHYEIPLDEQVAAHEEATEYLRNASFAVEFISPSTAGVDFEGTAVPHLAEVIMEKDLDPSVFRWEATQGVEDDIQASAKNKEEVHLYGAASQFNGCEATSRFTPTPGKAYNLYQADPTQGPRAQIQFSRHQVETLACAANIGFNGLVYLLDESTKTSVRHGYFTPDSSASGVELIRRLRDEGDKVVYVATRSVPVQWEWKSKSKAKWNTNRIPNTEEVHQLLVAAPAYGGYSLRNTGSTKEEALEIQFLCALRACQAQFEHVLKVREAVPRDKLVVFKSTTPGLGVFGNNLDSVALGFYVAAKQYEKRFSEVGGISIRLQVFRGGLAMANKLGLQSTTAE